MIRYKFSGLIAVALLIFAGCAKENGLESFSPKGAEPGATLVFERKWGQGKDELAKSTDVWTPSFEYYYVRGNEVFIADQINTEVKYYKDGKYIRSYDYGFTHSSFFGMVVIDDVMYWFVDLDGAVGVSITDGHIKYSRGFPFKADRNRYSVYQYGKLMIVSENAINNKGTIIKMCLGLDLEEVKCPDFVKLENNFDWSPYQYLSLDQVAFFHPVRDSGVVKPRVVFTDHGMHKIQGVAFTNSRDQAEYEMLGRYLISEDGVYFAIDTEKNAQLWFKPWWYATK